MHLMKKKPYTEMRCRRVFHDRRRGQWLSVVSEAEAEEEIAGWLAKKMFVTHDHSVIKSVVEFYLTLPWMSLLFDALYRLLVHCVQVST